MFKIKGFEIPSYWLTSNLTKSYENKYPCFNGILLIGLMLLKERLFEYFYH
jgi:hypothetical protein